MKAGFRSITQTYPADVKPVVAQAQIAELNADPSVRGILVQRPRCRSTLMPQP